MKLRFQQTALAELQTLANADRHSVLIEGPIGSGKSTLAKTYGEYLNIVDFASVSPTVQAIRDALDASYNLSEPIVYCIENLDSGVPGASYTLLKFLEEPSDKVYIVVTCRNQLNVPDTIVSRSTCVTIATPTDVDIVDYAKATDSTRYNILNVRQVWKGVKTLNDVDSVYMMTPAQVDYYDTLASVLTFKDTVSNIMWKLGHYSDNSETNIQFIFNYIINSSTSRRIQYHAIACVNDIIKSRIASHAVLAKFVLECKYGD